MSDNGRSGQCADLVAAVVVTYHRPDALERSLRALGAQERPLQRVYVVDNGGDLADQEHDSPLVRIIRPDTNTGAAGGFALGLQAASDDGFDWAYLLNDDDRPRPHAVGTLLDRASSAPVQLHTKLEHRVSQTC